MDPEIGFNPIMLEIATAKYQYLSSPRSAFLTKMCARNGWQWLKNKKSPTHGTLYGTKTTNNQVANNIFGYVIEPLDVI
jgi:hypothetical protein